MSHVREAIDELDQLLNRNLARFADELARFITAVGKDQTGKPTNMDRARERFGNFMAEVMTLADLLGRRRLLLEVESVPKEIRDEEPQVFVQFGSVPTVPNVTFDEAVKDIVSRTPAFVGAPANKVTGAPAIPGTAKEVADLYRDRHSFAIVQSTELTVTRAVQQVIQRAVSEGLGLPSAERILKETQGFQRSYSEVVYRTNVNSAYTAGRFQQARDPDVAKVIGGMEYVATTDSDVRRGRPEDNGENHLAAHGLIAGTDDPIWNAVSPPSGYSCRCQVRMVPRFELEAKGLIGPNGEVIRRTPSNFSAFRPHPNFTTRADLRIYSL